LSSYPLPLAPSSSQIIHFLLSCLKKSGFCIWEKIYDICLSESGLFHLTWWVLVLSIFLQTTWFHSFFYSSRQSSVCSSGCLQTQYVAQPGFKLSVSCLSLPNARTGLYHHTQLISHSSLWLNKTPLWTHIAFSLTTDPLTGT
jgi:hypothetical protein